MLHAVKPLLRLLLGWQGCGIVEFETMEEAATAVSTLDRSTVRPVACTHQLSCQSRSLSISKLPPAPPATATQHVLSVLHVLSWTAGKCSCGKTGSRQASAGNPRARQAQGHLPQQLRLAP